MDHQFIQTMYQQWCQGLSDPGARYLDFIRMASNYSRINPDLLKSELFKCSWFYHNERNME